MSVDASNRACARVLVVDDSAFMRTAISRMIASDSGFEVIGTAWSGPEALQKISLLDPDVITLDLQMPGLNGLETLRLVMSQFPRPVIVVSAATEGQAEITLQALNLGAFDYVPKQLSPATLEIGHIRDDLLAKLHAAAEFGRRQASTTCKRPSGPSWDVGDQTLSSSLPAIVAIGASTGGPRALEQILPFLPPDLQVPILVVQHMPVGFTGALALRLDSICKVQIREAVHGAPISPGVVYIAPAGIHMIVERVFHTKVFISLTPQPSGTRHKPSVDVLMKSVANCFGERALGIILTGMGSDGAEGMKAIHLNGGITIAQDETSCVVYGMPRACAKLGVLDRSVPLSRIPLLVLDTIRYRKRA